MEHNIVNISLGENCLMDALLKKYGIKQESYVFGSVRTNIEYNFEIIKDNFEDLLKPNLLLKKTVDNFEQKVVKNKKYSKVQNNIYSKSTIDSFEFTHHNVLDNNKDIESYNRKIKRTKIALESNDIIFWYHYRYSTNNNLEILINQFVDFIEYLSKKNKKKYQVCIFTQIVSDDIHFINEQYNNNVNVVKCYEKNVWDGTLVCNEYTYPVLSLTKLVYLRPWFKQAQQQWSSSSRLTVDTVVVQARVLS